MLFCKIEIHFDRHLRKLERFVRLIANLITDWHDNYAVQLRGCQTSNNNNRIRFDTTFVFISKFFFFFIHFRHWHNRKWTQSWMEVWSNKNKEKKAQTQASVEPLVIFSLLLYFIFVCDMTKEKYINWQHQHKRQ